MTDARTHTLALGGEWRASYGTAPCPVCQPERRRDQRALSIAESGGKLLLHCHKLGCDFRSITAAAGIKLGTFANPDPAALAAQEVAHRGQVAKRKLQALEIWAETVPIDGTVAEAYLRGRGIVCDLAHTLRFHPECWHGATARRYPALVAIVEGVSGFGIHRTYLRQDGGGKAEVKPAKMMLGQAAGGAVRLSDVAGPLVVSEGIENGLALLSGLLDRPATVWAGLSASGMQNLRLPNLAGDLIIAADSDDRGVGVRSGMLLAERAYRQGWNVRIEAAPPGMDWNDVLQQKDSVA